MSTKTQLQQIIDRRRAIAQEWLDSHPTPVGIDAVIAAAEHQAWVEKTAQSIVNSLPSFRAYQRGVTDENAYEASTEIMEALMARFEDSTNNGNQVFQVAQIAAHAMFLIMNRE